VWLLGSFAVLSLLYRADQAAAAAEVSAEWAPHGADVAAISIQAQRSGAGVLTKRAQAERAYATLSADGSPVGAGQLAAAGLSASHARALVAQLQARPPSAVEQNGRRPDRADTNSSVRP
jgi:hypothetical protein